MQHSKEFEALVDEARTRVKEIAVDAVHDKSGFRDGRAERSEASSSEAAVPPRMPRLIDVREDDEWRAAHIQGAEHIGKGVIERDIVQKVPDKSEELILYCGGGYRSILAADALQKMGYQRVFSMAGGWKAWLAKGYPTAK